MKQPVRKYLEKGKTYLFCTCGNSEDGVLCDGSHKGTAFEPKEFISTRDSEFHLCRCKKTTNTPFCDGSHAKREQFNFDFLEE
jgi:CDGSH-type Zn-finger protein